MPQTRWTMIEHAAAGRTAGRDDFAECYLPVVRDFLRARWRRTPWESEVDDAVQDVFVQCFRPGGALRGVRRDGRDIVAVNSRRDAASSEHSREFYGLFLSWWEQARSE